MNDQGSAPLGTDSMGGEHGQRFTAFLKISAMTNKGEKSYWYAALTTLENGALAINTSKVGAKTSLKPYRFSVGGTQA